MSRNFALAAVLAIIGAGLSADQLAIAPSDAVSLLVQRTDLPSAALALRIHRTCLESVEGRWPSYESASVDALCVIGKTDKQTISSMRIVIFGLAVEEERTHTHPTGVRLSDDSYDDNIGSRLVLGYAAHGRLQTFLDDVGQPRALGTLALEARDKDALLSFVACDTHWQGGGGHMPSLIAATCRTRGTIGGVRLFVSFDLVASTSRKALEGALIRVVRDVMAAGRLTTLNIPWRDPPD